MKIGAKSSILQRDCSAQEERNISRTSRIYGLDPYVDSNDLLRVGGKPQKGELDVNIAHPVLLPKNSCIYQLQSSDGVIKMWSMKEEV